MKRSSLSKLSILGLALLVVAGGCKKMDKGTTHIPGSRRDVANDNRSGLLDSGKGLADDQPRLNSDGTLPQSGNRNIDDPRRQRDTGRFQGSTVYFALDSATVRAGERSKLEEIASYIKANPNADILVEGHCDERGTEGYNLALGDRRALAVREALAAMGAPADNLHTVSFGEAKPAVQGKGEAAYSKNRRAAFVLVLPAQ